MPKLNLRFQKYDKYDLPVFICCPKNIDEKDSHNKLKIYHAKLQALNLNTFLPIYASNKYAFTTVRFKKSPMLKDLSEGNTYEVDFSVKTMARDGKTFVNVFCNAINMVKESMFNGGDILDLE